MAPIEYVIDPEPDTVITLRNPCWIFAPWRPGSEDDEVSVPPNTRAEIPARESFLGAPVYRLPRPVSKKEKKAAKRAARRGGPSGSVETPIVTDNQAPAPIEPALDASVDLVDESDMIAEALSASQRGTMLEEHAPSISGSEESVESEKVSVRYHVSSRHLMLASPMFRRTLSQNGFAESHRNEIDGLYYVEAQDWDAEAFLIVLRIVHGRNKQVPREVTLEMLAQIAILEDYYSFGEALEVFTEIWIQSLTKKSIPAVYCKDLVLWIWVAWVFDIEQQFTEATATAIKHSTESLRTLDLPIPVTVTGELDSKRYQAIESVMEGLHQRLEMYRRTDYVCSRDSNMSFQCGSFLLGGLMKELSRLGLYQPRPEIPFPDLSFITLCGQVRDMNPPRWFYSSGYHSHSHPCTLSESMATLIEGVSNAVGGLNLGNFKRRRDK